MMGISRHTLRRAERGGAAMIVAVLLGGGVLLGASALAVDVGNMFYERRQLQNGADSASRTLATLCAQDITKCDVTLGSTVTAVKKINNAQAYDGASALYTTRPGVPEGICGRVPGAPNLPPCPPDALNGAVTEWTECPALPPAFASGTAPYVQVYTLTGTATTSGVLSSVLGAVDSAPTACARYAWGELTGLSTFPLTFADCEVEEVIDTVGYGAETSLPLKYQTNPTSTACDPATVPSGGDYYGGFGWLYNDSCEIATEVPGWADGNTGVGAGNACVANLQLNKVYLLPIFTCVSDSNAAPPCVPGSPGGTHTWYYLDRYEAFQLTGYKLSSTGNWVGTPSPAAKTECMTESLDNKCIVGFFIEDYVTGDGTVDPDTPPGSAGPFGFQAIG